MAAVSVSMDDVRTVKNHFGVTVNDVVLAITNAAVVEYLQSRGELTEETLSVAGPVNIREDSSTTASGNHFSFMRVSIPSDLADPVERLNTIADLTSRKRPKRASKADGPTARKSTGAALGNLTALVDALPSGAWIAVRELVKSPALTAIPPVTNYVVSNIPGPKDKLFLAGAEITHIYGRTMLGAGVGLFIFCISYGTKLEFGLTTLAELVPDPATIANGISHHLSVLLAQNNGRSKPTPRRSS